MQIEPRSSSRAQLGFAESVNSEFSFLFGCYNMKCVISETTLVRYESSRVFIEIFHEPNSYELGIEIGQLNVSNKHNLSYGLEDVLEAVLGPKHNITTFYQSSNSEGVKQSVNDFAQTVKQYYRPFLTGDEDSFKKLEGVSIRRSEQLMKDRKLKRVREKATRAWENGDYKELVKLYESIKLDLTKAESKKLEYARKKL